MVSAKIKKQKQQLKILTPQLKNMVIKEGQSELSLKKSLVCIVGWCHGKELHYSVTQITHCLNNKECFVLSSKMWN